MTGDDTGDLTIQGADLPQPDRVLQAASRRRAWLLTAAAALLVLIYLVVWSAYATVHVGPRYRAVAPGEPVTVRDGQTRLLSLTRTDKLLDDDGGDPQVADAGATFVVAELELTQQRPVEYPFCAGALLGPEGRTWNPAGSTVQRPIPSCTSSEIAVGQPYRYEEVFLVPLVYADRLYGVTVSDSSTAARTPVLRPPA